MARPGGGELFIRRAGLPDELIEVGDRLTPIQLTQIVFTATTEFVNTDTTQFTYFAVDSLGLRDETPATVTITTGGTDQPPETVDVAQTIIRNQPNLLMFPADPGSDVDGPSIAIALIPFLTGRTVCLSGNGESR